MKHLDLLHLVATETLQSVRELRDGRWKNMLVTYVVFTVLSALVLTPLTALSVQAVVSLSGQSALTDTQIISFFLTVEGAVAGILLASVALCFAMLTYAALLVASRASELGLRAELTHIFHTITTRFWQLLRLSIKFTLSAVTLALPFVAGVWLGFQLLISEKDINFYLSEQPPSFWTFLVLFALCSVTLGALLIKLSIKWFYAIPLVLFAGMTSRQAKLKSLQLTRGQHRRIMYWLTLWLFGTPLLISLLNAPLNFTASWLAPQLADRLPLLALTVGVTLVLTSLISFILGFATLSMLARQNVKMLIETGLEEAGKKSHTPPTYHHIPLNQKYVCLAALLLLISATSISYIWLSNLQHDDSVMIIAHRGASTRAPENSLAAIQLAIDAKADWVEIDVQETADGEVIVFHDSDFSRLAHSTQNTAEIYSNQLSQIHIGAGQTPPTLREALALCQGKTKVLIELKDYGHNVLLEHRVVEIIEQASMQDQVSLMSLSYPSIQKMRQLRPHWKLGLLSTLSLGDITALDIDFIGINSSAATPALVKHAHDNGVKVYAWTVNSPLDISAMTSRGVDGIITDVPRVARQVIQQRSELSPSNRLLLELAHTFGRKSDALAQ